MQVRLTLLVFACFVTLGSPSRLIAAAIGQVYLYGGYGSLEGRFCAARASVSI